MFDYLLVFCGCFVYVLCWLICLEFVYLGFAVLILLVCFDCAGGFWFVVDLDNLTKVCVLGNRLFVLFCDLL